MNTLIRTALLEAVTGATDVMLVYLDPAFNFVWVNDAYAKTCRKRPDEIIGQNHFELYPDRDNETIFRSVRDSGKAVFFKDKPFEFPDQPERGVTYWDWSLAPVRAVDGSVEGLVFSLRETTRYKRAELRLAGRQKQLFLFIEQAPVSMAMFDRDMRYLAYSQRWLSDFGLGHADLAGRNHYEVHPDLPEEWKAVHRRALAGEIVSNDEDHWSRNDGVNQWLRWAVVPWRDDHEEVGGIIISAEDISEHKRAQDVLREANLHKDEFLAMLAHELRNPLVPIQNAAHVLGAPDLDQSRLAWARDTIKRQVTHLTRLVDDLLDISRIARGNIVLRKESVALAELMRQAQECVFDEMSAKGHRLEVRCPEENLVLEGDPVRLVQVLQNLLSNAAKYTPEGGRIVLTARPAGIDGVQIEVTDNGIGIGADLLPHVFDIFRQGQRSLDRSQGGLGVGLTLVSRLVELHGGRVLARSAGPGQGSTFRVHFPLARPAEQTTSTLETPAGAPARLRLLVVDDDALVAESMVVCLGLDGHEVRSANSGEAAMDLLKSYTPDAVLLDIGLPGEDGYCVAGRIRELPQGRDLPLVALSGYGHKEAIARSLEAGFDRHLVKPTEPEQLIRVICQIIDERNSDAAVRSAAPGGG